MYHNGMALDLFHPLIRQWFAQRFGEPTEPQRRGWPHIAANHNTLIAAPTGSGKTLAAFLVCLDRLLRQWIDGRLENEIQVVYVSPLKALSNDIERNLRTPLFEIGQLAEAAGLGPLPIRAAVRTGDTPASERQSMLRRPPHILVTTPESLFLLLTSERAREKLRTVKTVIVDEIHALARDKRGSHLALTLERLAALCPARPVRIGLSATQRPIETIAHFLVGSAGNDCVPNHAAADREPTNGSHQRTPPDCRIVDVGHMRDLDLALEVPPSELAAVCSLEQWGEVYQRLTELIQSHRSTLVFVNTRRLAERVSHHLTELLGEDAVASHHGSLSRKIRLSAEQRLKSGELKAIIATASLELGIDIGYIDLVCQIGSPRSIATFLQRVGRSGHSLGATPKGRLFPLTRDELLESLSLVRAVRQGKLDQIEIPQQPLDILAQQIIAAVACEPWDERELLELCRRAWPFRNVSEADFEAVIKLVSDGVAPGTKRGAYLHRDQIGGRLRARRGARLAAITSGGAIPEAADYRVMTESDRTHVGTVDEDFAIESMAGDVFLLGNTSWRVRYVRGGEVVVNDAQGAPPSIPFWFGEAPGRTVELSTEVSRLRHDLAHRVSDETESMAWLGEQCGANDWVAEQAVRYVAAQHAALGLVPTKDEIVFERFFDESGGMQLVIHSPLGSRINRAWGLALRKRFCRSFDFELQAAADDDGIVLSLSPQHSFPIENLFRMLRVDNARHLLEQALLAVPMFQVRWRWNVTRALAVLRRNNGKKVPPHLQRFRAEDLLAATFPETVGCLENHHGDVTIPDHPLVRQTMHDCLHEAMDLDRWLQLLADVQTGTVKLIARDTREPSPFCHELLNANPYAFLDDAPLEERRSRAVANRRGLSVEAFRDLSQLDPEAIAYVAQQAWPTVRDADELHDALLSLVVVFDDESADWSPWFEQLVVAGRAARVQQHGAQQNGSSKTAELLLPRSFWIAAERWPLIRAVFPDAQAQPPVVLPDKLDVFWEASQGWVEMVRGRIQHSRPVTAEKLAGQVGLEVSQVSAALEALEGEGAVLRGKFAAPSAGNSDEVQWCDRRLLARIHRLTLDGLRRRIQPVEPADFLRFLVHHHHLDSYQLWGGPVGVREAVAQLKGFEMPAGAWEQSVLAARVGDYDPQWLDNLFLSGEVVWGRLRPPRRDEADGPSMAALTRMVPLSLALRDDLPWLLPQDRADTSAVTRGNAAQVLAALSQRGALFFRELQTLTQLLPAHLEEALRELAALGLATADAFAAVRAIVLPNRQATRPRRHDRSRMHRTATPIGRWSCFPGLVGDCEREEAIERWCRLLLARYGVVFRELLTREAAAPPWYELVIRLRRMELRGEVRGGRFVSGVAGEQYATQSAVGAIREMRDRPDDAHWLVISAADPLNLIGVITDGPRIPATHKNRLILQNGRCIAFQQAGEIQFTCPVESAVEQEMRHALRIGRRAVAVC